jgi:hypothetical protein
MAEQSNQLHRDFTLLEITHITGNDLKSARMDYEKFGEAGLRTVQNFVQQKIEFGKRRIDSETKSGDLILIESPDPVTFEQFLENMGVPNIQELPNRELIKLRWELFLRENFNMYHTLADYARSKGRKVETLESGMTDDKSRLTKAMCDLFKFPIEKARRINRIIVVRRHMGMEKKIQSKKPQLVIAASGHVAQLEETFKPRRTIYQNPLAKSKFSGNQIFLAEFRAEQNAYLLEKRERRARIVAQLRAQGKLGKPKRTRRKKRRGN